MDPIVEFDLTRMEPDAPSPEVVPQQVFIEAGQVAAYDASPDSDLDEAPLIVGEIDLTETEPEQDEHNIVATVSKPFDEGEYRARMAVRFGAIVIGLVVFLSVSLVLAAVIAFWLGAGPAVIAAILAPVGMILTGVTVLLAKYRGWI